MQVLSFLRSPIRHFSTQCTYHVKTSELSKIVKKSLEGYHPYRNQEPFLKKATLASRFYLPRELQESLYDFKLHGNKKGYFLIRSLPTDPNLMHTPVNSLDVPQQKKTFYSEFWLSAVGSQLGDPYSYEQEDSGLLYHNVRAKKATEGTLSGLNPDNLNLHSETAFHPFYPDFLLLFCLRGDRDRQAKTTISSIGSIKKDLSPELQSILRKPLFKTGTDYFYGNPNGIKGNGRVIPILYGEENNPLVIFDPDMMEGITEKAQEAIESLSILFQQKKEGILLEPGDLLVLDNYRVVHGRTSFKPRHDGLDRWLQRLFTSRNLQQAQVLFGKKERIITYLFPLTEDKKSASDKNRPS